MKISLISIALGVATTAMTGGALSAQPGQDLARLTVPADRLSSGCQLRTTYPVTRVLTGPKGPVEVAAGAAVLPSNPWRGDDRRTVAAIRRVVDGSPPEPDGPPVDAERTIAFALQWAEGVVEAYGATYVAGGEPPVSVYAVRFGDEKLATMAPPAGTTQLAHGATTRVVLDRSVVKVVAATPGTCFRAISEYVRSLQ